jgi:hypothetical protein
VPQCWGRFSVTLSGTKQATATVRENDLDKALSQSQGRAAKKDISERQHLMERSFAQSKRYGYLRARWRRLWRIKIQEYLTVTIQKILVLVRNIKEQGQVIL